MPGLLAFNDLSLLQADTDLRLPELPIPGSPDQSLSEDTQARPND